MEHSVYYTSRDFSVLASETILHQCRDLLLTVDTFNVTFWEGKRLVCRYGLKS
jgi:hypothetical protein